MFESADGFFLDLTHPFAGQVEAFANFFKGHRMAAIEAEIQPDHIGFPLGKC